MRLKLNFSDGVSVTVNDWDKLKGSFNYEGVDNVLDGFIYVKNENKPIVLNGNNGERIKRNGEDLTSFEFIF